MSTPAPAPALLPVNQVPRPYRPGTALARFRAGQGWSDGAGAEDWVAATYGAAGGAGLGFSRLPNGTPLREAILRDPYGWLGADHVERFGTDPAVVVYLRDAGERLPVQCHPGDAFARGTLGARCGQAEAWFVVDTENPDACVRLGFREDISAPALRDWVRRGDGPGLLSALNRVPVRAGDVLFVPPGLPHVIGPGVFLAALAQPADLTVLLEWRGYVASEQVASLGLGFTTALSCVDRTGWDPRRLSALRRHVEPDAPCRWLLDGDQERFFRGHQLRTTRGLLLKAGFSILLVLTGTTRCCPERGRELSLREGQAVVVPYACGAVELRGEATVLHARPPAPSGPR